MQVRFPGSGRSLGEGRSNSFQYACPENPVDRSAWRAIVHRVSKSWTFKVRRLKRLSTAQHVDIYMYMIYTDIYILFHILFHYGLLQDSEHSSLHYTVGSCLFYI